MSKIHEALEKARREGKPRLDRDAAFRTPSTREREGAPAQSSTAFKKGEVYPEGRMGKAQGRLNSPEEHLVSLVDPGSAEAEQFRTLRHMVEKLREEGALTAIAVTSPMAGDGKSLVAANLAGALAQNPDSRVLLVDADLRKSTVHLSLGLGPARGRGLVEAVQNPQITLDDVIVEHDPYHLAILPAGSPPPAPYEVLKSPRFKALIDEARGRFDFLILDTPPVLACPDTRVVETLVDGFLIVVSAHKTPRKLLADSLEVLSAEKVLGLVFNRYEYHGRYYSYYYAYRHGPSRMSWWRRWR